VMRRAKNSKPQPANRFRWRSMIIPPCKTN